MRKLRIYIAGKMRGIKLYNFPAFEKAAEMLRHWGYAVISPAELDGDVGFDPAELPDGFDWNTIPEGFDINDCLRRDVDALTEVDAVYLLPGWEKSSGARMEKAVAEFLGLKVLYAGEGSSSVTRTNPELLTPDPLPKSVPEGCTVREVAKSEGVFADGGPFTSLPPIPVGTPMVWETPPPIPEDSAKRKEYPIQTGLLDYFPHALAAVAHLSYLGNEKHNPGEPLHWSRAKSNDHSDCRGRHCLENDDVEAAWRALAVLQVKLEQPVAVPLRPHDDADYAGALGAKFAATQGKPKGETL